jgi:pectate lyase
MHAYAFLPFLPAALACLNPKSNSCASYMSVNQPTASAFCATFTQSVVTATTGLPAWASNCNNKPSLLSKECSCYFTGGAGPAPTPTTTAKATTTAKTTLVTSTVGNTKPVPAPSGVTTTLPKSSGAVATSKPITVSAGQKYDGGMQNFDRSRESP